MLKKWGFLCQTYRKRGVSVPRPKKEVRNLRSMVVSGAEAAAFLNLPERSFYRLVEKGILPKIDEGEYLLGEVADAYWKNLSEGLEAARIRLTTAQAELAELELAEQRDEVHRASAVMRVWADNVLNAKTKLLAIPVKHAPELVGKDVQEIKTRLRDAISEALHELSDYDARRIARTAASFRE